MSVESLMDEGKKLLAAIGYKTMLEAFSKISELPDGVLELGEKGEWSYSIHKVKQGLYLRHMPSGFEFPKCPIGDCTGFEVGWRVCSTHGMKVCPPDNFPLMNQTLVPKSKERVTKTDIIEAVKSVSSPESWTKWIKEGNAFSEFGKTFSGPDFTKQNDEVCITPYRVTQEKIDSVNSLKVTFIKKKVTVFTCEKCWDLSSGLNQQSKYRCSIHLNNQNAKYKLHGAVHYLYGKLLPGPYTDTTNASTWESFLFIMGKNGQRGVTVKFGNTNICLQVVVREGALLFRYKEDQHDQWLNLCLEYLCLAAPVEDLNPKESEEPKIHLCNEHNKMEPSLLINWIQVKTDIEKYMGC